MRFVLTLLMVFGLLAPCRLVAAEVPLYRVGDVATNDVVASVPLVVTDPVATALLQEKEEREFRPIVRYCPALADKGEREFRSRMALLREEFLRDYLKPAYGKTKVDKSEGHTSKFLELTSRFRDDHKGIPKLFLFMPYWAQGRSDEHLLAAWSNPIRQALSKPVRADKFPGGDPGGTVRMVTVPNLEMQVRLDHAERYGVLTPLDNIEPLSQVRREMASAFPKADAYIADFLGQFVQPNCVLDQDLTRLAKARHVDSRIVAINYAAGDVIVHAGEAVDAKALAALDELRKRVPKVEPREQVAAPLIPNATANPEQPAAAKSGAGLRPELKWLIGGLCGGVVLVACVLLITRRRSTNLSMVRSAGPGFRTDLPPRSREADEIEPASTDQLARAEGESEREWRERAMAAEQRAEKARELARSNLAKALKDKVVEHLSTQRDDLIDRQQSAAAQMADLEARLQRIQGPLSERLRAYEQRIAELEAQLAVKDEQNRALIRAKIKHLRERMAQEKAGHSFDMN